MADPSYIVDGVLTDGEAWVAVDSDVLTGTATSITWTSTDDGQVGDWSQYMDLVVICYVRTDGAYGSQVKLGVNNLTSSLWNTQELQGDGASVVASSNASYDYNFIGKAPSLEVGAAETFGAIVCHLFDVNSGKYKSLVSLGAADMDTATADRSRVSLYAATGTEQAPISRIDLGIFGATNFVAGCRFDLFGILPRMVA